MAKELVSFVICTYNQEKYIEQAIEAAFSQTYSPLQIIISDDCSTDHTFDIIEKIVSSYSGPHVVNVNRNNENLGIAKHWDYISRKAIGDLIVHAAGDDISFPNRAEELVKVWKSLNPRPILLSSNGISMSLSGVNSKPVRTDHHSEHLLVQHGPRAFDFDNIDIPVCGFALAVDKTLYKKNKPITRRMWSEDEILRSRALLWGSIVFLPKILVRYGDGGLSKGVDQCQFSYLKLYKNQSLSRLNYLEQLLDDCNSEYKNSSLIIEKKIQKKIRSAKRRINMIQTPHFIYSLQMLITQLIYSKNEGISKLEYLKFYLVKWAPDLFFTFRRYIKKINNSYHG